jgi:hypothetical protein
MFLNWTYKVIEIYIILSGAKQIIKKNAMKYVQIINSIKNAIEKQGIYNSV